MRESPSQQPQSRQLTSEPDDGFGLIFSALPLPMWFYDVETLAVLAVNDAAIGRYGYSRPEFLAITVPALHPPDASHLLEPLECAPGIAAHDIRHHLRKDGTLIEVEVLEVDVRLQGRPARFVLSLDATRRLRKERERRSYEQLLAQTEVSFRAMVENAVFGMYRSTREGRLTMVNQTLVEMLGYDSASELIGLEVPHDLYLDPEIRIRLFADEGPIDVFRPHEAEWKRKNAGTIVVRVSGHAVRNERGEPVAYEAIVEDVTERHALEEQLRQSQKMEAIGLLAGGIAHDFNNLLTTIVATVGMLREERAVDHALLAELDTIGHVSRRGSELTRKLLTFGRKQPLQLRTANLADLVGEAMRMLGRVLPASIETKLALERAGTAVNVDAGAVEQILLNLITNARDAMPEGGTLLVQTFRSLLDETACTSHGIERPGRFAVLAVGDTGIGMDAETRRRVFEPFFTTKPPGAGTGLGLATVYGLAKQHGGFVHVYSEPGSGSSFKVYLPAAEQESEALPSAAAVSAPGGTETILLAEDETVLRRAARRALERHGYRVLEAADGAEALERYRARAETIDLVLSDVMMPKLTGPQLVEALRREGCSSPVLYMSGYSAGDLLQTAQQGTGAPLLAKPWTVVDLLSGVRQVFDETTKKNP